MRDRKMRHRQKCRAGKCETDWTIVIFAPEYENIQHFSLYHSLDCRVICKKVICRYYFHLVELSRQCGAVG